MKKMNWVAGAMALALALPAEAQERFTVGGDRVAIYNIAGTVEVVRGSGSEVVVEMMRGGPDAERLSVEIDEIQGRNSLRVIYPADRIVYDHGQRGNFNTSLRVRSDGTFGGGWGDRGERVTVRSSGSGMEAWADLRISVPEGRRLWVFGVAGDVEARGVDADHLELDTHTGRVTVDGLLGDLMVDTGSGSVRVTDVAGAVEVDTGSGSVDLDGVEGPDVLVDTGSGRVTARGVTSQRLEIDTGSGAVELRGVDSPNVLVDTGSGAVEVEIVGPRVDDLEVDTGSGRVTLRLPPNLDAEIEVDTGSGGIDVDFPVDVIRMSRNYFRGRVGDGRGRITVDTGSGRIQLIGG